jgi:hypothetical protein
VPDFSEDDLGHAVVLPVGGGEGFSKWAGQPGPGGGLAGSYIEPGPDQDSYDPQKKPSPFVEVGAFGLAQYGGFIRDEFLVQLQGDNALKMYREMWDNSPIIGGLVFAIQMLLRKVEWRIEPPEAASVEEIVAERMAERIAAANEQQKAQSQQLMMAQAGLAGNSPGQAGGAKVPGQAPIPQMGRSPLAQGSSSQTPFHQPISGPGTSPTSPGPNQPDANTSPGTGNRPELTGVSNTPGTNPSGSPAEAAGQAGEPGMGPGTGSSSVSGAGPNVSPAGTRQNPSKRPTNWLTKAFSFRKDAPASSGGSSASGISFDDPAEDPTDPETNEAMDFPLGSSPIDTSPAARAAEELAVFVETALHDLDLPWAEVISQIVTMIVYGWSFHEIVYKKRNGPNPAVPEQGSRFSDGRIGWSKLAMRAQETRFRWEFDNNGNVLGFWQMAPPRFQLRYIPLSKGLLFRTSAYKNNPEGRSVLRSAYVPYFFLKRIQEFEAIGIERDLAGMPLARVPYDMMTSGATTQQKSALEAIKKVVRNLRRNDQEGVVFPSYFDPETKQNLFDLTLLSASGSARSFDTDTVITRYEQRIAMVALADFILLGHDSTGARSLGETKADLFTTALEAFTQTIADVFNTSAIPKLMQMNGEDPAMSPRLTAGKMETVSLEELGALLTAMSSAGFALAPDTQLEDYLRERGSMPPKAASDDL